MPINILMPALSPTMEKGNLAKWLKKEGDKVKSGDVIAEIETDKATMEVEAVDEGTLAKIVVPEGTQDVSVNDVIAVLAGDGEDVKAAGAAGCKRAAEGRRRERRKHAPPHPNADPRETPCTGGSARQKLLRRRLLHRAPLASGVAAPSGQRPCPHFFLAAGASPRQRSRHRACAHHRFRSAWPRDRARCRGSQIRQGAEGTRGRAGRRAVDCTLHVGQANPRAVRRRQLRGDPA